MSVVDTAKMGLVAAREWGRLAGDALGDRTGHSMPFRPEDVTAPETLARLINTWSLEPLDEPVCISTIHRQDIPSVSSNCQNLVLTLEQPGEIPTDVISAYKTSVKNWDALLDYWFSGPLSLLHGDSHLGNFFVSGEEMGMLDWQAAHWGKGIRDVQYFLIDSLPADILAAHERDLVDYYVERRGLHGTAIDAQHHIQGAG
ncbi:MAG: phosphotransferase [Halioglobus sp.]